jgi:hypothetical protein
MLAGHLFECYAHSLFDNGHKKAAVTNETSCDDFPVSDDAKIDVEMRSLAKSMKFPWLPISGFPCRFKV